MLGFYSLPCSLWRGRLAKTVLTEDTLCILPLHRYGVVRHLRLSSCWLLSPSSAFWWRCCCPRFKPRAEAARRAQCQNNLKNIALGVLNYESTNKHLPVGAVAQPGLVEGWAWSTYTLPYLEEQGIYDQLRPNERRLADVLIAGKSNPQELVPLQTPLAIFRCPSDDTPATVPWDGTPENAGQNKGGTPLPRGYGTEGWERHFKGKYSQQVPYQPFQPSTSNYVGSKGFVDYECNGSGSETDWTPNVNECAGNGVFQGAVPTSLKKITDGTSQTIMLGERDSFCLAATWIGVRNPPGANMYGIYWVLGRESGLKINHPLTGKHNTCTEGFSSKHPGGAQFAFCDGSVHFLNDDIDFNDGPDTNLDNSGVPHILLSQFKAVDNTGAIIGVYQRLGVRNDDLPVEGY